MLVPLSGPLQTGADTGGIQIQNFVPGSGRRETQSTLKLDVCRNHAYAALLLECTQIYNNNKNDNKCCDSVLKQHITMLFCLSEKKATTHRLQPTRDPWACEGSHSHCKPAEHKVLAEYIGPDMAASQRVQDMGVRDSLKGLLKDHPTEQIPSHCSGTPKNLWSASRSSAHRQA